MDFGQSNAEVGQKMAKWPTVISSTGMRLRCLSTHLSLYLYPLPFVFSCGSSKSNISRCLVFYTLNPLWHG